MTSAAEQILDLHRDLEAAIARAGSCIALARELGISRWTVYRWRKGEHLPSYELGERLRAFLARPAPPQATPEPTNAARAIVEALRTKKGDDPS